MQSAVPSTIPALPRRMPKCTLVAHAGQLTHSASAFSVIGNAPGCGLSGSAQEAVVNNYQPSEPCELSAGRQRHMESPAFLQGSTRHVWIPLAFKTFLD